MYYTKHYEKVQIEQNKHPSFIAPSWVFYEVRVTKESFITYITPIFFNYIGILLWQLLEHHVRPIWFKKKSKGETTHFVSRYQLLF